MWVRGLKPQIHIFTNTHSQSHPMWVRGLKQQRHCDEYTQAQVAPYVGAWIETGQTV